MTDNNKYISAGQMLRDARTSGRRKRELSTIAKLLCISEDYLDALERSDYNAIPELVYILGFARNYAMEMGLNPDEIVSKIKMEMGIVDPIEDTISDNSDKKTDKKASVKNKINNSEMLSSLSKYIYKNWKWLAISLVAIIIAVFSFVFVLHLGGQSDGSDSYESMGASAVKEPEYKQEVRERFGMENRETAKVVLQANGESWVKIEDERGNTVFSRVLVAGDVYYVPSSDKDKATFGNAGGIDVWVNGNLIPKLGNVHERKSGIVLTPEILAPGSI